MPQNLDLRASLVQYMIQAFVICFGDDDVIGQVAPHITWIVNLVAAELGVSLVPAAMMQLRVTGIVYRQIAGQSPTTRLALAYRRGETSPVVRNFVARAVS